MGQDPGSDMENRNAEELPSPEVNGGGCLKQSAKALGGLAPGGAYWGSFFNSPRDRKQVT